MVASTKPSSPLEYIFMPRITLSIVSLFVFTQLAVGCASTPTATPKTATSIAPDCGQLSTEIASAEADMHAALEKEKGAWKAIVPFVVVARYADGKLAANRSDQQLDVLRAEFARRGCTHDVH
jgi:hypothetical protein